MRYRREKRRREEERKGEGVGRALVERRSRRGWLPVERLDLEQRSKRRKGWQRRRPRELVGRRRNRLELVAVAVAEGRRALQRILRRLQRREQQRADDCERVSSFSLARVG